MSTAKAGLVPAGKGVTTVDESQDMWLTTRARIVLLTTEDVHLIDGVVEAADGVITLRGRVRTGAERARAGLAVRGIDGVRGVRNFLQVVEKASEPEVKQPDETITDEVLKERLEEALKSDKKLEGLRVSGVNDGVVCMSGKGVTMTGRLRAIELAWDAAGTPSESEAGRSARTTDNKASTKENEHENAAKTRHQ